MGRRRQDQSWNIYDLYLFKEKNHVTHLNHGWGEERLELRHKTGTCQQIQIGLRPKGALSRIMTLEDTVGQNNEEYRLEYWATRSSVCLLAHSSTHPRARKKEVFVQERVNFKPYQPIVRCCHGNIESKPSLSTGMENKLAKININRHGWVVLLFLSNCC